MHTDNQDMEENALLAKLIDGDTQAFTTIYEKYSRRLYGNIFRLVKCEETAQEILQDLFLKIWENRRQIDTSRSFRSYLFKIGENLVYDYFRKAARDKRLGDYIVATAAIYYTHSEEAVIYNESLELIRKAIDQLPPVRRNVFILCKIEGKTYEEIASILHISTSTISDHIVKANKALKKYLHLHADIALGFLSGLFFTGI